MNYYYKILENNQIIGTIMSDNELLEDGFIEISKDGYYDLNHLTNTEK